MPIITSKFLTVLHYGNSSKSLSFASQEHAFRHAFESGAQAVHVQRRDQPSDRFAKKS